MHYSITQINALSVDQLDKLIWSERKRLLDENIQEISPTLLAAFAAKHSKNILILDEHLEQAGRTGLIEPRASKLKCEPEGGFTNRLEHHRYIGHQITYLIEFIIAEAKYLIENKAREISSDYFEAWATLQLLKIEEVKIYLRMPPHERSLTYEIIPNSERSVRFATAPKIASSSRSRAASTTAICPPSITPLFIPQEENVIDHSHGTARPKTATEFFTRSPTALASQPAARALIKTAFLTDQQLINCRINNKFTKPVMNTGDDEEEEELMFQIDDVPDSPSKR